MFPEHYDREGKPIDLMRWAELHEDREYSVIAQHWVRGWKVSTVWMGIDHNFGWEGPPVIFETMIFAPKDAKPGREDWETQGDAFGTALDLDGYQDRYTTEPAARAGHDQTLAAVIDMLGADAATDIISPAQLSDPMIIPDDLSGIDTEGHDDGNRT